MEQPTLFDTGTVNLRQFRPVRAAVEGAARFTHGAHSIKGLENAQADRPRAFKIQQAYKTAQAAPESPRIRKSYEAFRRDVGRQYAFMTTPKEKGGMGIRHEVVPHDPYATAPEIAADVTRGRIQTMATASTGPHAFLSNEENDRFRAVHDVFGHAATGRGVDRHGEEAAYLSHRQMFSHAARAALASETRGQNSYLNYGSTIGNPGKEFPEQGEKLIGLPSFAQEVRRTQ